MSDQIRPHRQQFRPGSEHDVGGHLGLVEDPVVAVEAGPDDGGQQRVDPPGERVENPRPRPMGELVAERLGPGQILHPHQRVVVTAIPNPGPVELAGQPFPAVDVDLDLIGQPRLDADMHEPELGVDQIQVVVHAFPFPADRCWVSVVGAHVGGIASERFASRRWASWCLDRTMRFSWSPMCSRYLRLVPRRSRRF